MAELREHYPKAPRAELLRLLPDRSWTAIVKQAVRKGIRRLVPHNHGGTDILDIPSDTSMTDLDMFEKYDLKQGARTVVALS